MAHQLATSKTFPSPIYPVDAYQRSTTADKDKKTAKRRKRRSVPQDRLKHASWPTVQGRHGSSFTESELLELYRQAGVEVESGRLVCRQFNYRGRERFGLHPDPRCPRVDFTPQHTISNQSPQCGERPAMHLSSMHPSNALPCSCRAASFPRHAPMAPALLHPASPLLSEQGIASLLSVKAASSGQRNTLQDTHRALPKTMEEKITDDNFIVPQIGSNKLEPSAFSPDYPSVDSGVSYGEASSFELDNDFSLASLDSYHLTENVLDELPGIWDMPAIDMATLDTYPNLDLDQLLEKCA